MNYRATLDLTRYHWVQTHGDLTLYGTWIAMDEDDIQPCMVLMPTFRHRDGQPCVVLLSNAYRYYYDPGHLLATARHFISMLGMEDNMRNCSRVGELIHSRLDDLCSMPPPPRQDTEVVAEATITPVDPATGDRDTANARTMEITEDV
ncbi:hypothetical protein [Zhongshania sp.]|uniref:hypothetical protein n=1 Tax=Zhongshania sp. TaxID=1971902 RepID=UPI00356835B6